MPIYVYKNDRGEVIEEIRLAKDKNRCPDGYQRVQTPQPIALTGNASNPADMKSGVLRGYYQEECKGGSEWKSDFTKKQIKKAWSE